MLVVEDAPGLPAYALVRLAGARALGGALAAGRGAVRSSSGIVGGVAVRGGERHFGWMLGPLPASPLGFELVPLTALVAETAVDALLRGPIDVPAAAAVLAARALLAAPLPDDPVVAFAELAARARAAGREVVCQPSFAWSVDGDADDRGFPAALAAFAARHPELRPAYRRPPGVRAHFVDRRVRLEGGRRVRIARPRPPLTFVRSADELRAAFAVRGERYVVIAAAGTPAQDAIDALVERIEDTEAVALAAPDAAALTAGPVLVHPGRFPQHVVPEGETIAAAIASLLAAARTLRRAIRVPGIDPPAPRAPAAPAALTAILLAGSTPEITRSALDGVLGDLRDHDRVVAVVASGAPAARRALAAYPQLAIVADEVDPFLCDGLNRALGAATTPLVAVVADDVLLGRFALPALRAAFAAIPTLGAAFPRIAGAPGGEGVLENYPDVAAFEKLAAARRAEHPREREPIEQPGTAAFVVTREALHAVGGIDPRWGPTRRGIAEFAGRLRAAGYGVLRCDDAAAHRFSAAQSGSAAAFGDAIAAPPAAADPAAGFDPRHAVPFVRPAPACGVPVTVVALPVASASELEHAASVLGDAARRFGAAAPVRFDVLVDGALTIGAAAARVREAMIVQAPLGDAPQVRVERCADLAAWRAGVADGTRVYRVRQLPREALAALPAADLARLAAGG